MLFPNTYDILNKRIFTHNQAELVPIRYEDRLLIMKWRNEQMYHLRQSQPLDQDNQDKYFKETVSKLFKKINPEQLLFSYLENSELVGYGGLVHIDWEKRKAEVSFIMNTELEKDYFDHHWSNYLHLIERVAFDDLLFNSIHTYAYDLRPHLYKTLENNGYRIVTHLKDEITIQNQLKDVLIHQKNNPITIRNAKKSDFQTLFQWSNDPITRINSYNIEPITFENHTVWYQKQLDSDTATVYILMNRNSPFGVVRFEKNHDHSVIGITTAPKSRGKGLSATMLNIACRTYRSISIKPIYAYIKEENIASIKSFQRSKFIFEKKIEQKRIPSVLYIRRE